MNSNTETIVEGIIITEPVFVGTYEKNNLTKGNFDFDMAIYSQRENKLNIMSVRTSFNIEKWRPLHKKERVKVAVLKNPKNNSYKKLTSKYDNVLRYSCNIVERRPYDTTL